MFSGGAAFDSRQKGRGFEPKCPVAGAHDSLSLLRLVIHINIPLKEKVSRSNVVKSSIYIVHVIPENYGLAVCCLGRAETNLGVYC